MEHRQKLWELAQGDASLEYSYSILHRQFRRSPRNFAIDLVPTIQGIEQFVTAEDKNAGQFERAHRSLQFSRSLRNVRTELIRALGDNLKEKDVAQEEVNNIIKTLQLPFDAAQPTILRLPYRFCGNGSSPPTQFASSRLMIVDLRARKLLWRLSIRKPS